ncbi:MAG: hypothetical protein LBL74_04550 [Bacteroidales bacterium]|nr:hypothetical protein [Bacteroidales bacterium]
MKHIVKINSIILLLVCIGCVSFTDKKQKKEQIDKQPNLTNTKWISPLSEDLQDYFIFENNGKCKFYSCETGNTHYGIYFVMDTCIILSLSDNEFRENHPRDICLEKLSILNDTIYINEIYDLDEDDIWQKRDVVFPPDYKFHKIK